MLRGFKLLHSGDAAPGSMWEITDVAFGMSTDWELRVTIARFSDEEEGLVFPSPTSFRAQDEGDLLEYWAIRTQEGAGIGLLYSIQISPYLDELKQGVSGVEPLTHYLIAGENTCVEVVSSSAPRLPSRWMLASG